MVRVTLLLALLFVCATFAVAEDPEAAVSVKREVSDWAPQPSDPADGPPRPKKMAPWEWFAYVEKMHKRENIHCTEMRTGVDIDNFLMHQTIRKRGGYAYERMLGGLYYVSPQTDQPWFGFCKERVDKTGVPDPHPLRPEAMEPGPKINGHPTARNEPAPPPRDPQLSAAPTDGVARDINVVKLNDKEMEALCQCECKTPPATLGKDNPYDCKCHCPPLRGDRGERGYDGEEGDEGEMGVKGPPGTEGPVGFPGRLPSGRYPFDHCDCYHESVEQTIHEKGWQLCKRSGYLVVGFWNAGERDDYTDIQWLKCCQPCLKVQGDPESNPTIHYESRGTAATTWIGQAAEDWHKMWTRAVYIGKNGQHLQGYCEKFLNHMSLESNKNLCDSRGSSQHVMIKVTVKVQPKVYRDWQFRVGTDFDQGGAIFIDGQLWVNRAGENLFWNHHWSSDQVLATGTKTLSTEEWHTIEIYGLASKAHPGRNLAFEVNYGKGWQQLSREILLEGSSP
eukprot:TRINITY_DN1345_c0_g2_i1.p1 TRINITY_DN1345_c0_g2~~TRINITY_DN1345_c0_g2_i1.p1  ORF type:complete len:506 (+),score=109.21 TRINITY_DN1345_c0_g2_i1:348-1865(+)